MSATRFRVLPNTYQQSSVDKRRGQWNKALLIALFTIPGMVIFFLFLLVPVSQSVYFSLFKWDGLGPATKFVGGGNYTLLFNQAAFVNSILHSFVIMSLSLLIQLPLALGLALLVGRSQMPGKKVFRLILFIPFIFSEIITALIWSYVLKPVDGMLNTVIHTIFPAFEPISWLGERNIVLLGIFAVITWKYFGFHMILYMAGLQSIPKDLEDAARVDGATERQVLRNVTLPLLGSTIRLTIFLSVLGSFQQFVIVWVLTQGGPVGSSELIATYLYKFGIVRFQLGLGSAVAIILFAITLIFSIGYQRIVLRQDYAAGVE
jgi:raffinose/stachyose/melibiose transport system permease protein